MRRAAMCLGAVVLAVCLSTPATAGVKDQFKCEATNQKELPAALVKTGRCIAACVKDKVIKGTSGRECTPPFDPITRACADKEQAKYLFKLASKCKTTKLDKVKMPQCGSYADNYPDILTFGNDQLAANTSLVEDITEPQFFCDQALPANSNCSLQPSETCETDADCASFTCKPEAVPPFTNNRCEETGGICTVDADCQDCVEANRPAFTTIDDLIACEAATVDALGKLSGNVSKCLTGCYSRKQTKGETTIGCDPFNGPLDSATNACISNAENVAETAIVAGCSTCTDPSQTCLPNCGLYAVLQRQPQFMIGFVTSQQFPPFEEDDPDEDPTNPYCGPRVCGDGTTTPPEVYVNAEQCDKGAGGTCSVGSPDPGAECVNDDDCTPGGTCTNYTISPDDSACPGQCDADCTCP